MDPFWTVTRVRRVLRYYHELAAGARPPRDPRIPPSPPPRLRAELDPPELEAARLLADLHLGLARLHAYRPDWFELLVLLYIVGVPDDPHWFRRRELERCALYAAATGRPYREVVRSLTAATVTVAALLAGDPPPV